MFSYLSPEERVPVKHPLRPIRLLVDEALKSLSPAFSQLYSAFGRPSIPPGVYFRMILAGYFEGIASQRGIAWRCSDSRSLAEFLGIPINETTPDHSSLSRVHGRLPLEVHEEVFVFVLKIAADKKLLKGKTVGVDSTTLEANAAMKSIERKDTGEDWKEYVTRLMREAEAKDQSHRREYQRHPKKTDRQPPEICLTRQTFKAIGTMDC
jgi:transposase